MRMMGRIYRVDLLLRVQRRLTSPYGTWWRALASVPRHLAPPSRPSTLASRGRHLQRIVMRCRTPALVLAATALIICAITTPVSAAPRPDPDAAGFQPIGSTRLVSKLADGTLLDHISRSSGMD